MSFKLSAPIVVAGETRPEGDAALAERLISVNPDKNTLREDPMHAIAFARLRKLKLRRLSSWIIRWSLSVDVPRELHIAQEATEMLLSEIKDSEMIPTRVFDNLMVMVHGLRMFEKFAEFMDAELPELDIIPALTGAIGEVMEGDGGAKDPFDGFIESINIGALHGWIKEGMHYVMVDGILRIHLSGCYAAYLENQRRKGLPDETDGLRSIKALVREKIKRKSYVIENSKRTRVGENFVRCVCIDPEEIPDTLSVEEWPVTQERHYGGDRRSGDRDFVDN